MTALGRVLAWHREPESPRVRRWMSVTTLAVLLIVTPIAISRLPDTLSFRWPYLVVLALAAVPTSIALNAAEFMFAGSSLGVEIGWRTGIRISVQGTVANLLPVPGAVLVRAHYLTSGGASVGPVSMTLAAIGIAWLGTALVLAGTLLLGEETPAAVAATAIGAVLVAVAWLTTRRVGGSGRVSFWTLLGIEAALVATQAVRFWLVFQALSLDASVSQSVALAVTAPIASAVGLFPAGLGVREAAAAVVAALVGLSSAAGLVGAVLDRVAEFVVLIPLAFALALLWRDSADRQARGGEPDSGSGE